MAPSKKRAEVEGSLTKRVTRSEDHRVTRSETRKKGSSSDLMVSAEVTKRQKQKKAKTPKKTQAGAASKEKKTAQSEEANADIADVGKEIEQVERDTDDSGVCKIIVIERCTQCSSFKRMATAVKEGLEAAVPGIRVVTNPEKPRRGCLEVRDDEGQIFLSLLDMKRPFTAMKQLKMEKVIPDIVKQIKA